VLISIIVGPTLYWNRRLAREGVVRKRMEIELQAVKEDADAARETANQAKSIFLANMSHESNSLISQS